MALLSKAQIFGAEPLTRDVEVPEWGGSVRLKAPTVRDNMHLLDLVTTNEREVEAYKADMKKPEAEREGLAKVEIFDHTILQIISAVVDEDNKPMFTVEADYDRFRDLPFSSMARMFGALTQLRTNPVPINEQAETLKKSSAPTLKGSSSSASRSRSARR